MRLLDLGCAVALTFVPLLALGSRLHAAQLTTRSLQGKPAVLLAAFGTSTRAQVTYDAFENQLRHAIPGLEIRWAFTSEVIRERVNERAAKAGSGKRLLSLPQALADLEADGYTRVAVQPLHITPGEEYEELLRTVERFPGLRIEVGETLLHRWKGVSAVLQALSSDFLREEEGCNVVVAHGSPTTSAASNVTLLGLERYLQRRHPNAFLGTIDGIVTRADALSAAKAYPGSRVRFIPLMFVGGDHVMNDVMGERRKEEPSWRAELEAAGKSADILIVELSGERYYKGLGFYPEVNELFIREIGRALARL
jgi:sirohydrochlorin cobaltochelatase